MASKSSVSPIAVRTRRAYFDCRFGQLHVRTAFPTTGGFDEQVTLFCLHPHRCFEAAPSAGSCRTCADVRFGSMRPICRSHGESDPSPARGIADAAMAIDDLAKDLRLRQIDLLGVQYGAEVALELAAARPELIRRLVLGRRTQPGALGAGRAAQAGDQCCRLRELRRRLERLVEASQRLPMQPKAKRRVRLNKYISETGVCSRREADKWIDAGRVTCNGRLATLGTQVADGDEVCIDGQPIGVKKQHIYIALNKPVGVTCTTEAHVEDNNIDLVGFPERIFPIGRLDKDSEGLILLTNNGDIVNEILRSENNHEKSTSSPWIAPSPICH